MDIVPSGPSVTTFVFLGDWTDLLLPLGGLLVLGLLAFAVLAARKKG